MFFMVLCYKIEAWIDETCMCMQVGNMDMDMNMQSSLLGA